MEPREIVVEKYGGSTLRRKFFKHGEGRVAKISWKDTSKQWAGVAQFFSSVFLPQGYPESVSEDYFEYQLWDTIQAFCSSITGTLATRALLQGMGVGDENATVLAATLTWLMKDGTGMLGRILFAWMQGSFLDCDCKRWRLFADVLNDFAIFIEICAPFFKEIYTFVICVAGVCKSIVGVAGGSTRAALTQHQARRNNMADVSAKDGSQETLVNLSALICSFFLIPLVTGRQWLIWLLFIVFTALHLYANYRSVGAVKMETFNLARLHIVVQDYLKGPHQFVTPIKEANKREPLLWKTRRILKINIGCSLSKVISDQEMFSDLCELYQNSGYFLSINLRKNTVNIALHERSDVADQLRACFHAEVLENAVKLASSQKEGKTTTNQFVGSLVNQVLENNPVRLVSSSLKYVSSEFPAFIKAAKVQGWAVDKAYISADEWRSVWDNRKETKKSY